MPTCWLGTNMFANLGHRVFHCFRIAVLAMSWFYCRSRCLQTGILCGNERHIASPFQAAGAVIGLRNSKTASRRSRSSSSKLNHNDKGSVCSHTGGMNRGPARLSRRSCAQSYPATIAANASTCASQSAMLPGCSSEASRGRDSRIARIFRVASIQAR